MVAVSENYSVTVGTHHPHPAPKVERERERERGKERVFLLAMFVRECFLGLVETHPRGKAGRKIWPGACQLVKAPSLFVKKVIGVLA